MLHLDLQFASMAERLLLYCMSTEQPLSIKLIRAVLQPYYIHVYNHINLMMNNTLKYDEQKILHRNYDYE